MARGAVQPEEAEAPLSAFEPKIQELRPHSSEALLRTAPHPCYLQDLLRAACHCCNHFPRLKMTLIDDLFTFNDDGYILFDQNKWDDDDESLFI